MDYLNKLAILAEDIQPVANARVVAAIVYRDRIISYGFCAYKTHPIQQRFGGILKPYLHAEISAIVKASKRLGTQDLSSTSLYIVRIKRPSTWSKEWVMGLAKPCMGCRAAIEYFKIKDIYYSEG